MAIRWAEASGLRYISVERASDGYYIDPTAYLVRLPELADLLPAGAHTFATDPQHYDFNSGRFIKNLKPQKLVRGQSDGVAWLELQLRHNCWRHEEDLAIRYHGVSELFINPAIETLDVTSLREVLVDEILPNGHGCSHEIVCLGGSITVVCDDLIATWSEADCPER